MRRVYAFNEKLTEAEQIEYWKAMAISSGEDTLRHLDNLLRTQIELEKLRAAICVERPSIPEENDPAEKAWIEMYSKQVKLMNLKTNIRNVFQKKLPFFIRTIGDSEMKRDWYANQIEILIQNFKKNFKMIAITYIYAPNERTEQTAESLKHNGYEVAIMNHDHRGNGENLRKFYECFQRAVTGHETFFYVDGADTYCQKYIEPPNDRIVYSVEKACYPQPEIAVNYPHVDTPWKYLNGGGYGGRLELIIEFFERYGLTAYKNDANGQHEQAVAFLQALDDGFPIELDYKCKYFQTMAFADPSEFVIAKSKSLKRKVIQNKITKSIPAFLHFNGLSPMDILKQIK